MLKIGDTVKLLSDTKQLRENSSYRQREYYAWLAEPKKEYIIDFITPLQEVYLRGETNYFNYALLERC